ncbi:MAG: penicillin-binding protein 1C, partial [Victivallales bacterium]|nr:penicillin-binding protein 1C [Victivallales bacterium]
KMERIKKRRFSTVVLDKDGLPLREFRGVADCWTFWVDEKHISHQLKNAFIAVEDKRYYSHHGIDPIAVARALTLNALQMRRVSGASTLSMQTMRMIEPRRRTYYAKMIESFQAIQFEKAYTKNEILEWYLNLCPFGGDIYGIEAASRIYFGKSSHDLNLPEAALLAGVPQRPTAFRPDRFPEKAKIRRDHVLEKMFECGFISENEKIMAQKEEVSAVRNPLSFHAPHFSLLAKRRRSSIRTPYLRTTINSDIQKTAKFALSKQIEEFDDIHNGAVVVIENATGSLRAMIGSPNFFDDEHHGQVNCGTANRSPGSTLKPFIYAMAFESGKIIPSTVINDVPTDFNGYRPMNFDRKYHGGVSAEEALINSYNIPAVWLLREEGVENFIETLRRCGVTTLAKSARHYGLPLILGSGSANLLEPTSAYSIFPNHGIHRPVKLFRDEIKKTTRVFGNATADMVNNILKDEKRIRGGVLPEMINTNMDIAWKTGTSYGFHDAWTIAYTPEYTVGVWLGNADGSAAKTLVGLKSAAPLCLNIIKQISSKLANLKFVDSANLADVKICSLSGMPA